MEKLIQSNYFLRIAINGETMSERIRILDVNELKPFRTIYEAINWCVGTNYTYWGRACWPNVRPTDGFRLWFTQLAYVKNGRYVPAAYDCINLLCSNGNYHVFDKVNPKEPDSMAAQTWKYDLIFSKQVGGLYYFRGVFIADNEHSAMHHYVSKRVSTKVKLIGCPARRLELLNSVDAGEFDENYLEKQVVSSDVVNVGRSVRSSSNRTKSFTAVNKSVTKPVVVKAVVDYEKMFPEGCRIKHISFGVGVIKEVERGILTVVFNNGLEKQLGAEFCVEKKLIEIIE